LKVFFKNGRFGLTPNMTVFGFQVQNFENKRRKGGPRLRLALESLILGLIQTL